MAALTVQAQNETTITHSQYERLIGQCEQLRILKNFVALEEVYSKDQIKTIIKAMEANNE